MRHIKLEKTRKIGKDNAESKHFLLKCFSKNWVSLAIGNETFHTNGLRTFQPTKDSKMSKVKAVLQGNKNLLL